MSYTYGHEAAKKKNDMNTYRNLVRKGIVAKKAKKLGKEVILGAPVVKGIIVMDSLGRSTAAYLQSWQDRNSSNNGTKLNP
ncbi:hypothetical protein OAW80_03210 [Acidimicrobiia bacterium]|nr:hypothetical protein [Acidimicrobiia bacterium]